MTHVDRVVPLLVYEDLGAAHDFLVGAFGFESGGIYRNDEGQPTHAEVRAGDTAGFLHFVEDVDHAPHEVKYGTSGTLWMAAGPGRVVREDCVAVVMQDYEQPTG